MTVGDLINGLEQYDSDLEVYICLGDTNEFWEIEDDDTTYIEEVSTVHRSEPLKAPRRDLNVYGDQMVAVVVGVGEKQSLFFSSK